MKKYLSIIFSVIILNLIFVPVTFAHVVVKPAEVGVGAFQTFTIGVPTEKDNPTVGLRLVIPEGLDYVMPNVKPGWTIETKKTGEGEDAKVTEINWTGGSIPAGQRDEFIFSAKVPAKETSVKWKAYQTYEDGTVVSWDQEPSKKMAEEGTKGPYSQTQVIDDIKKETALKTENERLKQENTQTMQVSFAALALAAFAVALILRKK
jgi:uncharacterized protein YcnI